MAGLSLHHPWSFAFGLLGNIISFLVYVAPVPTFRRICRTKSTEGFQSVPYVVALFSSMLWIYYALVKSGDVYLLVTINAFGCVIETAYVIVFLIYAPKAAKISTAKLMLLLNVGVFGAILLCTLVFSKGPKRVVVIGWICVAFSVSVFAAPLSIMRLVIRTKSVEFMPFTLSFFLTISAVSWFAYGMSINDYYVAAPNVLGFTFGMGQMVLYMCYKRATAAAICVMELERPPVSTTPAAEVVINIGSLNGAAGPVVHPVEETREQGGREERGGEEQRQIPHERTKQDGGEKGVGGQLGAELKRSP